MGGVPLSPIGKMYLHYCNILPNGLFSTPECPEGIKKIFREHSEYVTKLLRMSL